MSATNARLPHPLFTPFALWAAYVVQELAAYNVPTPPNAEEAWRPWAERVYAVPALIKLGCPNPQSFPTWKPWALAFHQVTG